MQNRFLGLISDLKGNYLFLITAFISYEKPQKYF